MTRGWSSGDRLSPSIRPGVLGRSSDGSWARMADSRRRSSTPGSNPSSSRRMWRPSWITRRASACRPARYSASHEQTADPLPERLGGNERLELDRPHRGADRVATRSPAAPRSPPAAAPTTGRSPPTANSSYVNSASGSPRHSESASVSSATDRGDHRSRRPPALPPPVARSGRCRRRRPAVRAHSRRRGS